MNNKVQFSSFITQFLSLFLLHIFFIILHDFQIQFPTTVNLFPLKSSDLN